jgi:hypothetical protein
MNFTRDRIHAVVFEDVPPNGDVPDHFKYKIRISETVFHTTELFPEFTSRPFFLGKDF